MNLFAVLGALLIAISNSGGTIAGWLSQYIGRRLTIILFVVLYAGAAAMTLFCWANRGRILRYRRQVSAHLLSLAVNVRQNPEDSV